MARLFFSYTHLDEALRDRLEKSLVMLRHEGLIESWHDRRIRAGDVFDHVIADELENADVILLLVSPDFLASPYCWDVEVKRALERHREGTARVIPVILRPCEWKRAPFAQMQATPTDGRPITQWPDQDEAFLDVTKATRSALEVMAPPRRAAAGPVQQARRDLSGPRSSNLRLRKEFTEEDQHRFLEEAFSYLKLFFENSLRELEERNPGISTNFRQIDANHFTAVVYRSGKTVSQCKLWLDQSYGSAEIRYSASISQANNSWNETMSVDHDDQSMFLKAMGMQMGGNRDSQLTFQGGAEHFWSMFIRPLQH